MQWCLVADGGKREGKDEDDWNFKPERSEMEIEKCIQKTGVSGVELDGRQIQGAISSHLSPDEPESGVASRDGRGT